MITSLKIIQTTAKLQLRYSTAMIAGLITNIAWGVFRYYLVSAFFLEKISINGFTKTAAATYVPLTQSLMVFLDTFGSMEISNAVHSGEITNILLRPIGFIRYWLFYYTGKSGVNLIFRSLLLLIIFQLFFPFQFPDNLMLLFLFLFSLCLSWLLSHLWIIVINLSAFWLTDSTGILRMAFAVQQLLTGMLFPLRVLPGWFQKICSFTPFPSMLNTPVEIFTNTVDIHQAIKMIIHQCLWVFLFFLLTQYIYQAGIRRLEINGG